MARGQKLSTVVMCRPSRLSIGPCTELASEELALLWEELLLLLKPKSARVQLDLHGNMLCPLRLC